MKVSILAMKMLRKKIGQNTVLRKSEIPIVSFLPRRSSRKRRKKKGSKSHPLKLVKKLTKKKVRVPL
jgi:hypothetical protein